jgi:hypothetical protein
MTATLESVWQALAADAPTEAARARPVLDDVLRTTHASSWPEVAWCSSTLTPDGAPVEFVWRPGVRGVFWAAEVAGPETRDELRFPLAIDRLGAWGPAPRRQLSTAIARLQHRRVLRFGAWIGGRHVDARDSYKVYAEVPPDADWLCTLGSWLGNEGALARCREALALRCVGIEPGSDRVELYLRPTDPRHERFWAVLSALSLEDEGTVLLATLAQLAARPGAACANLQPWGLGLRYGAGHRLDAVSLFATAPSLARNEARLRRAWRALAQGDRSNLAQLWVESGTLRAVIAGVTVRPGAQRAEVQLGLAPRSRVQRVVRQSAAALSPRMRSFSAALRNAQ